MRGAGSTISSNHDKSPLSFADLKTYVEIVEAELMNEVQPIKPLKPPESPASYFACEVAHKDAVKKAKTDAKVGDALKLITPPRPPVEKKEKKSATTKKAGRKGKGKNAAKIPRRSNPPRAKRSATPVASS